MKQKLALLGSTGSIGVQTLDIVAAYPDLFEVITLTSNRNWEQLAEQAIRFQPDSVVIADKQFYPQLRDALARTDVKVYAGAESLEQVVRAESVDTVVNALVGYAGLMPSVSAVSAGKKLALANKESLVVAGEIVMRLARENRAAILPVDSEHSAIFQCLAGETNPIEKIILTASGGPFRNHTLEQMGSVSVADALAHPNWTMGAKITVDSASMMNKGFEVIEARWLFGLTPSQIEVVVHPQSVIHSMVEFADGAIKAQLGTPDMHVPIQYALTFPGRLPIEGNKLDFRTLSQLTFTPVDGAKFPNLALAFDCLERGGNRCCTLNAANEIAVAAFLEGRMGFTDITKTLEHTLARAHFVASPSLDDYIRSDMAAREIAAALIGER